jgi:hypothetical protein
MLQNYLFGGKSSFSYWTDPPKAQIGTVILFYYLVAVLFLSTIFGTWSLPEDILMIHRVSNWSFVYRTLALADPINGTEFYWYVQLKNNISSLLTMVCRFLNRLFFLLALSPNPSIKLKKTAFQEMSMGLIFIE